MAIAAQVEADLKTALKARRSEEVGTLRLIRAALQNQAKELGRAVGEEEEVKTLSSLAKQRKDSIEQFAKGGRQDLVDAEEAELAIIQRYLPAQLDQAAVEKVVAEVVAELEPQGMKDMGRVMKEAMTRLAGQADGKLVNQLVRARLA